MLTNDKFHVCFDGVNDFHYYRMMQEWKRNSDLRFEFPHTHGLPEENPWETIKPGRAKSIRQDETFVVLIGESTRYLHVVNLEITHALELHVPIIGVNLNGLRFQDRNRCPEILQDKLAVHISFNALILQYALETWPRYHAELQQRGKSGPYYYNQSHYDKLGLGQTQHESRGRVGKPRNPARAWFETAPTDGK
ncbi:molecular chaperone Tir [Candidatus Poribacteria bacterium]|nr:MAG: molecular chaperone Tir [Candidatus Poribacteria bacterium]